MLIIDSSDSCSLLARVPGLEEAIVCQAGDTGCSQTVGDTIA